MKFIDHISKIAADYDTFFVDQFGVVHDGKCLYDGAVNTLLYLKSLGKQVWFISNSGKRADQNIRRNQMIGLPSDMYDGLLSSGEVLHRLLADDTQTLVEFPGDTLYEISRDAPVATGSRFNVTMDIHKADFIVLSGVPNCLHTQQRYFDLLRSVVERNILLVCSNPDKVIIDGDTLLPGAGAMADRYQKLGGDTLCIGKPHPLIYTMLLKNNVPGRILCIGDSIEHDISGASQVGLDSLLIREGIYKHELKNLSSSDIHEFVEKKCQKYPPHMQPTYFMNRFGSDPHPTNR